MVTLHVEVCAWYHLCYMLPAFLVFTHQAISYPSVCYLLFRYIYTSPVDRAIRHHAVCYLLLLYIYT